jgi:N utilization substance protein B
MSEAAQKTQKNKNTPRHASRIAAVQALYQIEQTNDNVKVVIRQMIEGEFPTLKQEGYIKPDIAFFEDLVNNTSVLQVEFDEIISAHLAHNWKMERLASVVRTILRLGTYELKNCLSIPDRVIINEYIEITKAFFDNKSDPAFVNGILDKLSQEIRA